MKGSGHGASCSDADHSLAKPQEAWRSVFWRGGGGGGGEGAVGYEVYIGASHSDDEHHFAKKLQGASVSGGRGARKWTWLCL